MQILKKIGGFLLTIIFLLNLNTPVYATDFISVLVPVEDSDVSTFAVTGETWTVNLDFDMKDYWKSGFRLPTQWVNEYYTILYEKDASNGYVVSSSIQPTYNSETKKFTLVENSDSVFSYVGNKTSIYNRTTLTVKQSKTTSTTYECNNIIFSNFDIYDENNNLVHSADYQRVGTCSHTGGTAYCNIRAICDLCGLEYGDFDSSLHNGVQVVKNNVPPTATEEGYSGDLFWSCCDTYISAGQTIPPLGDDSGNTDTEGEGSSTIDYSEKIDNLIYLLTYVTTILIFFVVVILCKYVYAFFNIFF